MRLHEYSGADGFGFLAGYASVSGIGLAIFWDTAYPYDESGDAGDGSENCEEGRYRFGNYRSADPNNPEDTGKSDEDHDPLLSIIRF